MEGRETIGYCSVVGISEYIIHGRTIGKHSVIGSGFKVLKDIEDWLVTYEITAKFIKVQGSIEKYL